MLIYIDNLNINNLNFDNIKQYKSNINKKLYIFSLNNIYTIKNNIIYLIDQIDAPVEYCKINNYTLIIDKSYWKTIKEVNFIPFKHIVYPIITYEYSLNCLDEIKLIVEYIYENKNLILNNFYFLTNKTSNIIPSSMNYYNIEIIDTFISLLRNIN